MASLTLKVTCERGEGRGIEMASSGLVRWGGIAAVAAGLVYIVLVLSGPAVAGGSVFASALGVVAFSFAILAQLVATTGLHALQREHYGRLGAAGFWVTFVGFVLWLIGFVSVNGVGVTAGGVLEFFLGFGILGALVGLVLLGIATRRARLLPSWFGVLLIVGFPATAVLVGLQLAVVGFAAFGLLWLVTGYVLLSSRSTRTPLYQRVR